MALEFSAPVDIANHGLQLLGVDAITATSFQTPDDKASREMSRCYDKLRVSELRRATWRFATRRVVLRSLDPSSLLWTPPAYSVVASYLVGQVVLYTDGYWYQAQNGVQVGDIPNIAVTWLRYFGPQTLDPFDTSGASAYYAGELVVMPEAWLVGSTYALNTLIARNGLLYVSTINGNIGHDPATDGINWNAFVPPLNQVSPTGPTGPFVYTSFNGGPVVYLSLNTIPATPAPTPTLPPPSANWLAVNGTVTPITILYPLGTGPTWELNTLNIFHLPYGYVRHLPTNPKGGLYPPVGGPAYNLEEDDLIEGNYVVSMAPGPALMRFVADVIDVSSMDAMFCRGLGATMAMTACEPLTQAQDKMANAVREYKEAMGVARTVNAIEIGTVDPVEDELIAVRL